MRSVLFVVAALATVNLDLVASQFSEPPKQPCIADCFRGSGLLNPNMACGDAQCQCDAVKASSAFGCILKCPQDQKDAFAAYLSDSWSQCDIGGSGNGGNSKSGGSGEDGDDGSDNNNGESQNNKKSTAARISPNLMAIAGLMVNLLFQG